MHLITSSAIAARAAAIGVPLGRLAVEAGLAPSTLYRWGQSEPNVRTLRAVQRALEARERALLLALKELHPDLVSDAA